MSTSAILIGDASSHCKALDFSAARLLDLKLHSHVSFWLIEDEKYANHAGLRRPEVILP